MNNRTFTEQLRLLSQNGIPEAGELLNKLEELASERGYSSIDPIFCDFEVAEKRRIERKNADAAAPMSRLQILCFYRMNGAWPSVKRVMRTRGNMRRVREVRRHIGAYIY